MVLGLHGAIFHHALLLALAHFMALFATLVLVLFLGFAHKIGVDKNLISPPPPR